MGKKKVVTSIIIFISVGIMVWSMSSLFSGSGPSDKEKVEIIKSGIKGVATLLSIERTGNTVNSIHQYEFMFKLAPDSGAAFNNSEKKLMDPIYMPSVKIGMQIPAYISRDEDKEVVILWKKVGIGDAF